MTGPLKFIDDPQANLCVLMREVGDGSFSTVKAVDYLSQIDDWLKREKPGKKFKKMLGACFWYE
jgi:hypothetical protein